MPPSGRPPIQSQLQVDGVPPMELSNDTGETVVCEQHAHLVPKLAAASGFLLGSSGAMPSLARFLGEEKLMSGRAPESSSMVW